MIPENEYLFNLGKALYINNYLEWLIIEIIRIIDPEKQINSLAAMEGGKIANTLKDVNRHNELYREEIEGLVNDYELLIARRNDIVHARPATTENKKQRLYRWAPTKNPRQFFIENDELSKFADDTLLLNHKFNKIRQKLKSR